MLRNLDETATPLGLIVVEGYSPEIDWLRAEDLLAVISAAPEHGVLWCGTEPAFGQDDGDVYRALVDSGTVVRDERSFAELLVGEQPALDASQNTGWDDPEIVTLGGGPKLVVSPKLRLVTQASASIIDDSWSSFLSPLSLEEERRRFHGFHGLLGGVRSTFEGLRREFAIERDFEKTLRDRVGRALSQHHAENGAIVVHGQSGVGKSIALARLSLYARVEGAAVLHTQGKLPQAGDVSEFLQAVDQVGGVTLIVADATVPTQRYDDLLRALRSAGHRVVVVGSTYRIDRKDQVGRSRLLEVSALLSKEEKRRLQKLVERFVPEGRSKLQSAASGDHALARFYRALPESRSRISEGLGREARLAEHGLRVRGARRRPVKTLGALGMALADAGFEVAQQQLLPHASGDEGEAPAGRIIDYVMASSRLFKNIPIGLLLRAVAAEQTAENGLVDTGLVLELFQDQDLFRWKYGDEEGSDLLIGSRLQIEAEIVCNRRLGSAQAEAEAIIALIRCAYRAGPDDNDETRFVVDIVQAMGPDGPAGGRYRDQFADVGRALTDLRAKTGVMNGRLMLQESALRRAHVRTHADLHPDTKATLLVEATKAVDGALDAIDEQSNRIYASRRTREHLLVERAATYGFLATDAAQNAQSPDEIWSSYKAAREATLLATGRVDSYPPLDIALWTPARILRQAAALRADQTLELKADIWATLDLIDPGSLDPTQYEMFQRQRLSVADVLGDVTVGDEAFEALDRAGSTVGYFIRARTLAPIREAVDGEAVAADVRRAHDAVAYLREHYARIAADPRCIQLMLTMEWLVSTRRWLFKGLRQPIPANPDDRLRVKNLLLDLGLAQADLLQPRYRYLEAVLTWLDGGEDNAIRIFRELDHETKFVEAGRVLARHVLTDDRARVFDGMVERQIGQERWSVFVETLNRRVDLLSSASRDDDLAVGRTVHDFSISFNFRGPLVDRLAARQGSR
jgi:hypothetical protein